MDEMRVFSIGKIENAEEAARIVLDPKYAAGLTGLEGYSHVQVLWWASECDNENDRATLMDLKPYTPSVDRIEHPQTPSWCSHWPQSYEESGDFDWEAEFNF